MLFIIMIVCVQFHQSHIQLCAMYTRHVCVLLTSFPGITSVYIYNYVIMLVDQFLDIITMPCQDV